MVDVHRHAGEDQVLGQVDGSTASRHCQPAAQVSENTEAVPAMKPEATTIGISARWTLENNLDVSWVQVLRTEIFRSCTLQQMTRQLRHW